VTETLPDPKREAAIQRIRDYVGQLQRADRDADQGSLQRAEDLELIYQDMRWADDLPQPKHEVWRGRPVDPKSRNRFAGWVLQTTGMTPGRVRQLHLARDLMENYCYQVAVIPEGERVLRPLRGLVSKGYGESVKRVYENAVKLAGGSSPTARDVTTAKREFLAQFTRTQRKQASEEERLARYHQTCLDTFRTLAYFSPELAAKTLAELQSEFGQ
jgi:hypothetical protein